MKTKLKLLTFTLILLSVKVSLACGGLFCNNVQPVNQVAERIVFAKDGDQRYQMHVQIQYEGPPQAFSWMLPVPRNTEFNLSLPKLFSSLDQQFAPVFTLRYESVNDCRSFLDEIFGESDARNDSDVVYETDKDIQVLSRENIGPYEKVDLVATDVETLTTWLTTNGYQVPDRAEEVLGPYIESHQFIAIKLQEGRDAGDIQPVALSFNSPKPSIPIIPTSVAASPDMGMIVNILADQKAIPSNYALVEINEALIDWFGNGSNYSDVVSHAIDESPNGQGFTIDYAGIHELNPFELDMLYPQEYIDAFRASTKLSELVLNDSSILLALVYYDFIEDESLINQNDPVYLAYQIFKDECIKQGLDFTAIRTCYGNDGVFDDSCGMISEMPFDGTIVAERIEREVNFVIDNLKSLFDRNPYLTRLYTTLSAEEMTIDPEFSFNPDVNTAVDNNRNATVYFDCESGENLYIKLRNGNEVDLNHSGNPNLVERENGETVRGEAQIGAVLITRPMESGQPEVIIDNRPILNQKYQVSDGGCQQNQHVGFVLLSLLMMLSVFKRVRSKATFLI